MATPTSEIESLKVRITELERALSQLQARLAQQDARSLSIPALKQPAPAQQIWASLLVRGIIRSSTLAELALSAAWRALPEAEQIAVRQELRALKLNPPLSEIIHKMRSGWYPDQSEWATEQ